MTGQSISLSRMVLSTIPFLLTILAIILSSTPIQLPGTPPAMPPFGLMAIFFWAVHRPNLMPPVLCFVAGVFADLVSGGPLGLSALTFLLVHRFVNTERGILAGRLFLVVWFGFSVVALAASAFVWLFTMGFHMTLLSPTPVIVQFLLAVSLYPIVAFLLASAHVRMA